MSSSDYVIGLLAVMCIILSLIWMKNANKKENMYRELEEAKEWARKWNQQRTKDMCDSDCLWCSNSQFCKLKDV
jgi:hypothetical protein